MTRICVASSLAVLALAAAATAQDSQAVYQQQKAFRFTGDTLARYEWTKDIPGDVPDVNRWRLQLRPRVEMTVGPVQLGVGGDFDYSEDENDKTPDGATPAIIRDNYRSRDARLELAWAKVTFGPVSAQGGRFFMPIPFTEMIWDRDLRPQGGAAQVQLGNATSAARLSLHGIYALGSHVFDDEGDFRKTSDVGSDTLLDQGAVRMYGGAAELSLGRTGEASLDFMAGYLEFDKLNQLEPAIRRQNTRVDGLIVNPYKVVDLVGRLSRGGQVPAQLVIDYCWNSAIDANNKGLWLAVSLGAIGVSPARLEYTYAKIDKDATVAAYNTDDFFWGTGWEGHRGDLGVTTRKNNSVHAIAQWQRFKDSPDPVVQEQWVKRYRLEWRTTF